MIEEILLLMEEKMDKTIANLSNEFAAIRTGRASAAMLDRVMVDYYGTPTPVTQMAGIKTPEATLLVVEPWDKSTLDPIVKAIQASDLGITPSSDGSVIRLPFPAPTEERRRELVKQCRQVAEESKVALRSVRRDANNRLERLIKEEDFSKDEVKRAQDQVQKATDEHVALVDEALKQKEAEVMEV